MPLKIYDILSGGVLGALILRLYSVYVVHFLVVIKTYQHSQTTTNVLELLHSLGVDSISFYSWTALRMFGVIQVILLSGVFLGCLRVNYRFFI